MTAGWDTAGAVPLPPKNAQVVSPFQRGMLDLRWEDPQLLSRNSGFDIVGVNIYRSEASDRGPYRRINEFPIGGNFYRDRTDYQKITKESVSWGSSWLFKGDAPNDRRWRFKTQCPISKRYDATPLQEPTWANAPTDVQLYVNGVEVPVSEVFGRTGEVTLVNAPGYDIAIEKTVAAAIPDEDTVVEVSYYTPKNHVRSGLDIAIWYRLATVAIDATTPSGYVETPLEWCEPRSVIEVEALDYIWREAMRRNAWILQQGGERSKVFVRKTAGVHCSCGLDERTLEWSKQPSNRCLLCFGTSFLGGYEGPYEVIIVPDDGERRISQAMQGRRKEHTYEVWTSPSPMVTQRDFIVKQTNERYSIGPVRRPSHRGNHLQQHFTIGYIDEGDMRYRVPIDGTTDLAWPEIRGQQTPRTFSPRPVDGALEGTAQWPEGSDATHPLLTEKDNIPDEREQRGRTRVWENTTYGIIRWLLPAGLVLNETLHRVCGLV